MAEVNVEIVRRGFEALQAGLAHGDPGAAFDSGVYAADLEWILPPGGAGFRDVYVGREGFIEFMKTWTEDFDWSIELERLVDAGDDRVVGVFRQRATGRGSGVPVELYMGVVYELEHGRVVRIRNYLNPAKAFEAAGLDKPR
jgi:ketosteroid isomerase-like protein